MDYIAEVNIDTKSSEVGTQFIGLNFDQHCQNHGIKFVKSMGYGHYIICEKDGKRFLIRMKCHRADWGYLLYNVKEEILCGRKIDFVLDFVYEAESEGRSKRAKTPKKSIEYHYDSLKEHLADLDNDRWEEWENSGKEASEFKCYEDEFSPVCVQICCDFSLEDVFWHMNDIANGDDWEGHLFAEYDSKMYDYYYE